MKNWNEYLAFNVSFIRYWSDRTKRIYFVWLVYWNTWIPKYHEAHSVWRHQLAPWKKNHSYFEQTICLVTLRKQCKLHVDKSKQRKLYIEKGKQHKL